MGVWTWVGILIVVFLIDVLFVIEYDHWRKERMHLEGVAYCGVCGDFGRICCRYDDGTFPRCFECCDHSKSESEDG